MTSPQLTLTQFSSIKQCLQPGEIISAFDASRHCIAVGSSLGSVFIFECGGGFVVRRAGIFPVAVSSVCIKGGLVVCASASGLICIYDWLKDVISEYGAQLKSGSSICTIAASPTFDLASGKLFIATSNGVLQSRARGKLFGFSDSVIFRRNSQPSAPITNFHCVYPFLIFACGGVAYVYHDEVRMMVADIQAPSRPDGHIPECHVYVDSSRLLILFDLMLYVCERDFEKGPFQVLSSIELSDPIVCMSYAADNLVLVLAGTAAAATNTRRHTRNASSASALSAGSGKSAERQSSPGQSVIEADDGYSILIVQMPSMKVRQRIPLESAFVDVSGGLLSMKNVTRSAAYDLQLEVNTREDAHVGARQVYLVCQHGLMVLRPMKVSEQVAWMAESRRYEAAMYLCKKHKRNEEKMEVANEYACYMWDEGQHETAVGIWAEYILPFAPAEFWNEFARRLDKADKIYLLEKHCPVTNPHLLSAAMYQRILERRLRVGNYHALYDLIAKWPPACYNFNELIIELRTEIEAWEQLETHPFGPLVSPVKRAHRPRIRRAIHLHFQSSPATGSALTPLARSPHVRFQWSPALASKADTMAAFSPSSTPFSPSSIYQTPMTNKFAAASSAFSPIASAIAIPTVLGVVPASTSDTVAKTPEPTTFQPIAGTAPITSRTPTQAKPIPARPATLTPVHSPNAKASFTPPIPGYSLTSAEGKTLSEAAQRALSEMLSAEPSTPRDMATVTMSTPPSSMHTPVASRSLFASTPSVSFSTPASAADTSIAGTPGWATDPQRLSQLPYLYHSLFKLYEFAQQSVEALRVLLSMGSLGAIDYFIANTNNQLWSYFDLKRLNEAQVEERREILLQLLFLDGPRIVNTLAEHVALIDPTDIVRLLCNHPFYRLPYLEACFREDDLASSSRHHVDMIQLYINALSSGLAERDVADSYTRSLHRLLRYSVYNLEQVLVECKLAGLEDAVAIIEQRSDL
eukprot:TRINITY_DN1681_c0_g1_i1.p1 TRINITY_DN1681_c0_g1~~TRINITY_DN1681_c0_g1_i1.p1  ORF type:complete len:977 (-),score=169.64 TRINITY_DN1681_c0_g1_i1:130-3060(-)